MNKKQKNHIRIATLNMSSDPEHLQERNHALNTWISQIQPDILALQETEPWQQPYLQQLTETSGYQYHHMGTPQLAVLSKLPIHNRQTMQLQEANNLQHPAIIVNFATPNNHTHTLINTHLAWGPDSEPIRLNQFTQIETWAATQAHIREKHTPRIILTGDLNAMPHHITLRWARGEDIHPLPPHHSTTWIDAWEKAHTRYGDPEGITSDPLNPLNMETAARHAGILTPHLLPKRRIDYILIRGYSHGSQLGPKQTGIWGQHIPNKTTTPISDHYGIWADLQDLPA